MLAYHMIAERFHSPELGEYDTYSIVCYRDGEPQFKISDVGCDKEFVQHIVNQLNEQGVAPCHVMDIINDSL